LSAGAAEPELQRVGGNESTSPELSLVDAERGVLVRASRRTQGNVTQAARLLGISRDTLRYRIEKFGLKT
jgi:DNA-binding protein Fis